ncbi:MAG: hypothetical protein IMZ70_07375 [Candidatus Atribacteria bacterium]|nr:hypothetical protein [Candidatus Atribacteria bacterium]
MTHDLKDSIDSISFPAYCERALKIITMQGKLEFLNLNTPQMKVHSILNRQRDAGLPMRAIILKARREGVCLAPETRVLMADLRWVAIKDISLDDKVMSVDEFVPGGRGNQRRLRVSEVEAKKEIIAPTYKIDMSDGRELIATGPHRFLCRQRGGDYCQWRAVSDLKVSDVIRRVAPLWSAGDFEDGWMGGLLDGEGTIRPKTRAGCEVTISQCFGSVYDRAKRYLEKNKYHFREDTDKRQGRGKDGFFRKPMGRLVLGRLDEIFKIIGQTRPVRLLGKDWWQGKELPGKGAGNDAWIEVIQIEPYKNMPVFDLQTTSKTFIAEGFVSHNSTYVEARYFREINRQQMRYACVCSADTDATDKVFKMASLFQQEIPGEFRRPTEYSNRKELVYSAPHRSQFLCQTAGKDVLGRGGLTHLLHPTEFSFWNRAKEQFGGAAQEVPDDPETIIVIESTSNGTGGAFYDMFVDAVERWKCTKSLDGYIPIFLPWYIFDYYRRPVPEHWKPAEEEREIQAKHKLDMEQLYWRHWAIENKCQGDIRLFRQEYPACVVGDTQVDYHRIVDLPVDGIHIVKRFDNGDKEVFRLQTVMGYTLDATAEHHIKTPKGFVKLGNLVIGSEVLLKAPLFTEDVYCVPYPSLPAVRSKIVVSEEIGRLLGYFMGDGSFRDSTVSFACNNDGDVRADIYDLAQHILGVKLHSREVGKKQGNAYELRAQRSEFVDFFSVLGCLKDGRNKRNVCVPICIKRSPKGVVREFLRGLFESDGFNAYGTPKVSLFSRYLGFLRDVQLLLLGFGITCRLASEDKIAGNGKKYIGHVLQLRCNEAIEFNAQIGFVSSRKRSRNVRKMPSANGNAKPLALRDVVKSIEPVGIRPVYDLNVEPENEYSANGICVHNSWLEAFQATGHPVFTPGITTYQEQRIRDDVREGLFDPRTGTFEERSGLPYGWKYLDGPGGDFHAIGCDTTEYKLADKGDERSERDYDGAVVLERKVNNRRVKAKFFGRAPQNELGLQLLGAGKHFNNAWIAVEVPQGVAALKVLIEAGYPNLYSQKKRELQDSPEDTEDFGFRTTPITRHYLVNDLISHMRSDGIIVQFQDLLDQMRTFIWDKDGKPRHMPGKHDDDLFALALALQADLSCPKNTSMDDIPVRTGDGDDDYSRHKNKTLSDLARIGAVDDIDEDDEDGDDFYHTM